MATLAQLRTNARQLLNERSPADAFAAYYALHHNPARTTLFLHHNEQGQADGFLARAQTGMDLFRSLVTFRAATDGAAESLFNDGLLQGRPYYLVAPLALSGVVNRNLYVTDAEVLRVYRLDAARFNSEINVLVTSSQTPGGHPRFEIASNGRLQAAAGLNWKSPHFAEVYVYTEPAARGRGWGRSVVSALAASLLKEGVTPLYVVNEQNSSSIALAERVGFVDTGAWEYAGQVVRQRPAGPSPSTELKR